MVQVTWPRWSPCPYIKNLLQNQKSKDLETWHEASMTRALWCINVYPLLILTYFTARSNLFVYVFDYYFQTYTLKPLGQSPPNLYGASLGRGNKNIYKWSRSHGQDGRHAHISKTFSRTRSPKILKLGMKHL